ncbi:MAG: hypothetical protein R2708_05235 [Vicinamibacterales bacterium]
MLHYTIVRPEAPNSDQFQVFANSVTDQPERRSRYELHLPYTIVLRLGWGGDKGMVYFRRAAGGYRRPLPRLPHHRPQLHDLDDRPHAPGVRARDLRPTSGLSSRSDPNRQLPRPADDIRT